MADKSERAMRYFIWSFFAVIIWGSLATVVGGDRDSGHHGGGLHSLILGSVETMAAAAFLLPRLRLGAGAVLLAIFVVATILTLLAGETPAHLVFYACTVIFILVVDRQTAWRTRL